MSASNKLLAEFKGRKIEGKTLTMLAFRIDGLLRIAEATERHRCFEAVKIAGLTAQAAILRWGRETKVP